MLFPSYCSRCTIATRAQALTAFVLNVYHPVAKCDRCGRVAADLAVVRVLDTHANNQ